MYIKQHAKHTKLVAMLAALACLVLSVWLGWHIAPVAATSQKSLGTKTVDIDTQTRMDPVTVNKVTVGDQQIQAGVSTAGVRLVRAGSPFQADEDWLKNMTIVLKNRTDKVIVRAEIMLYLLDGGDQLVMAYNMTLGQRPEIDSFKSNGQKLRPEPDKKPFFFAPGQTFVIKVADYADEIQSEVEAKVLFSQITRLVIERTQFFFADGMRWNDLYGFGIPDPNHPGQFTNMDRGRYFPGDPSQNLPPGEYRRGEAP